MANKKSGIRGTVIGAMIALALVQGVLQAAVIFPLWRDNYAPKKTAFEEGLSPDQMLFVLAGFREMIAGILWVQGDKFFEEGNYDAILPIIYMVTRLDPHQIDVYATGMWHIGYNFTDEEHRSDRRYIPTALALGKEGMENNPETYELFFETGWLWYHKIDDDYDKAVKHFQQAAERPDILPARRNLLANAYQRAGQVDKALELYYSLLDQAQKRLDESKKEERPDFQASSNFDTITNNLDNLLVRMAQRGWFAKERGEWTEFPAPGQTFAYDTQNPFDVGFSVRVTVEDVKVLRVQGTWRVTPVGTRVRFILRDANFPRAVPGGMEWDWQSKIELDPPTDQTFLQEQLFVRNQRFDRKIDMSRDPTMYPALSDEYVMEFYYNPRSAPAHIQDKFGWNGEGFTDRNFLNTTAREGQRVMFTSLKISKDQLNRQGRWRNEVPIIETPNYVPPPATNVQGDILEVPGLRAE